MVLDGVEQDGLAIVLGADYLDVVVVEAADRLTHLLGAPQERGHTDAEYLVVVGHEDSDSVIAARR